MKAYKDISEEPVGIIEKKPDLQPDILMIIANVQERA